MILLRFFYVWAVALAFAARWATLSGRDPARREAALGDALIVSLTALGPLYVKLGQVLATRPDLIPPGLAARLASLQDDVPPMAPPRVRRALRRAYGRPPGEVFASFTERPVASASIAQVHEATLPGGQKVAVKIVRDDVERLMAEGFTLLRPLVWLADRAVPACGRVRALKRFDELRAILLPQCDMATEAANQEAIRANFEGHPHVYIPEVYGALTRRGVLVMDFVEGLPGKRAREASIPPALLARRAQDAIYTMLYFHGLCHADPHPGNLFVTRDGRIAFIDFGIVARLTEAEKLALSAFFFACTRHEWEVAVRRFTRTFVDSDPEALLASPAYVEEMTAVLRYHFKERTGRWSTLAWFHDANAVLLARGAIYSTSFTRIELVFFSGEGFISLVDPDIDIWENARRFNDRYSPYLSPEVKEGFDAWYDGASAGSRALTARAAPVLIAQSHLDRCVLPSNYPLFVDRAEGSRLTCVDGHAYVDLSCGYGPHILGYAHPVVVGAVAAAAQRGCVNALGHEAEVRLAELLVEALPGAERALFSNSGTEAVIGALRLCRAHRGREVVAKFEGHYHGFSDEGLVSSWFKVAGDARAPQAIEGSSGCGSGATERTLVLQYGQEESLTRLRAHADALACVLLEPAPTAMGGWDGAFLTRLRAVCTELGVPLVFDEVVTGFRVDYGGVQTLTGITPDLTCLGKIIGGSLPCGAVVGRADILDRARTTRDPFADMEEKAFVSGTMSGNSLATAAGAAVLTWLRDHKEIYAQLDAHTAWIKEAFLGAADRHGVPLLLKGGRSILAMAFEHKRPRLYRDKLTGGNFKANLALSYYMRKRGVYLPELHTFMLSAAHTEGDLALIADAFDASLGEMVVDGFFTP